MGSFVVDSIIVSDSDEFSSFEIDESVIDDQQNESLKTSSYKTASNTSNRNTNSVQYVNESIAPQNYRSPLKDSSHSSSESESDAIVLSTDDEESCSSQTEIDSSGHEESSQTTEIDSSGHEESSQTTEIDSSGHEESGTINIDTQSPVSSKGEFPIKYKDVTNAMYNAHVAKIGDIKDRINQNENLLKLSSQLPDKGHKLKQRVVKLKEDLVEMQTALKTFKIKETIDISLDFKNLSINEKETTIEFSFEGDNATVSNLFKEIKRSEKSMPTDKDFADQPRLINGNLMPHQRRALAWMIWRENQFPKGGILGDDMGLGKTLTVISLIARHIEMRESTSLERKEDGAKLNGRTLVVCPASVIRQWEDEIGKFTNYGISVCLHHGDKRSVSAKELTMHEVVITTYGIVRTEVEKSSALSRIHWERIVLDEAHTIRNYTSKQSLTCCRLMADRRWALTGTPIQNKHGDVYALIKYLQCDPLDTFNTWKEWTSSKPEQKISYLLKFLLLRRTKADLGKIGEIKSLPEKKLEMIPVKLTTDELRVYETVASFSKILSEKFRHQRDPNHRSSKNAQQQDYLQKALDFFTISGSVSTSHILLVILRLRQICIHPNLIDAMLMEEDIRDISGESNMLEELNELTIGGGGGGGGTNDDKKLERSNPVFDAERPSSKFDSVLRIMKTKVIDRREKAVVVSQFTSVLRLFESHLRSNDIKYLILTGATKIAHRQNIVQSFNEDPNEQILLLSLTAGGVGLNLCGANNLFFIDPHWNPQLESQAEDRVYRIGQTKPVTIYRFICEGTIEERIQKLQERKKGVAKNILNGYKLNIDDMMALI